LGFSPRLKLKLEAPVIFPGQPAQVIENVVGSRFADKIFGNAAANLLMGGGGDDSLFGRDGFDTLLGEEGRDSLFGGRGNDTLNGGGGLDKLFGEEDHDTLDGGGADAAADELDGGGGVDTYIRYLRQRRIGTQTIFLVEPDLFLNFVNGTDRTETRIV
jgi:Ca2+-binding RTX toxin-like protein